MQRERLNPPALIVDPLGMDQESRVMNMSDDRQNVVDMAGTRVDDDH